MGRKFVAELYVEFQSNLIVVHTLPVLGKKLARNRNQEDFIG